MRPFTCLIAVLAFATACTSADAPPDEEPTSSSADVQVDAAQDPIAVAMSAAPAGVAAEATIMEFDENGELVELRAGTNGWLCVPDENPAAPGDAPACFDGPWQNFVSALMSGEAPSIDALGVSYMLQGGPFASNDDPSLQEPPEGESWTYDGPHIMMVVPDPAMLEGFPTEYRTDGPYVMWAGTPYAHLMVPVPEG